MTTSPTADPATLEAAPPSAAPLAPFSLRRGTRLQLGARTGTVEAVRWSGSHPYDVKLRWDGEKYPQFLLHRTLEFSYTSGALKLL